eukprot:TRINITY_DN4743_c0_g1_i1.p1 TRINITY_DN4743_c0_g1~~TRINITY_DN4743_c0_g1_i1.p1  ORF type:complete len:398 (+),score=79.71 TRINITY_DN4743_c0_g1_i1:90-1283(+)
MGDTTIIPSAKRQHVGEEIRMEACCVQPDSKLIPERLCQRRSSMENIRYLLPDSKMRDQRRNSRIFAISPTASRDDQVSRRTSLTDFQNLLKNGLPTNSASLRGESTIEGMKVGIFETQGSREGMEDRHDVCISSGNPLSAGHKLPDDLGGHPKHAFFAIYDGHGGTQCADFVHDHLYESLSHNAHLRTNPQQALQESLEQMEREYTHLSEEKDLDGLIGTTVLTALIQNGLLTMASIGDSQAIICRNGRPIKLTYPHTPHNTSECNRITSIGGKIHNGRLSHPSWNPNLIHIGVTRSIGDIYFKNPNFTSGKESGLISTPEITQVTLTSEDSFIFLASDGYWDVVTPQETVAFVTNRGDNNPNDTCRQLTLMAMSRASTDNITTLLIKLNKNENQT